MTTDGGAILQETVKLLNTSFGVHSFKYPVRHCVVICFTTEAHVFSYCARNGIVLHDCWVMSVSAVMCVIESRVHLHTMDGI